MPGSLKTEAIVLRSMRYGEADRILHLFTPDRGRLSAIAKGVRRAKSRFGGRLEPYFRLQMVLYQGRSDLFTVTSAETIHGYPRLREHGGTLDAAARACDAVARMFDDHDAHRGVYHLLANQLALLDADAGAGHARRSARVPAQAAAGRRLRAPARRVRGLWGGRAPRRLLRRGGRRGLSGLRGQRVRPRPGRARLHGRRARPAARGGARRSAARARPGRAGDHRDARASRESAPSSRRSVTNLRSPPFVAGRRVIMDGVSAPVVDPGFEARIRAWEDGALAPAATRSYPADRARPEEDCGLRTPFQRDRDRIVHCKAFRRLKHKTQVFVAPEGDHYRTRLTHTLETTQISRTVARALRLNEDLTEAIGLGHDLGHPPFGHIGEDVLDRAGRERYGRGFRHNEHSLRVVEVIEDLNLTAPVRDGILRHSSGAGEPATLEGKIVRLVDRIAYINHDIDDALRAGVIAPGDLPDGGHRDPRRHGLAPDRHARARPGRALRARRRHRPGRAGRRRDAAAARLHVRPRVPRPDRACRARQDRARAARAVRVVRRASGRAAPGRRRRPTAWSTTSPA